MDFGRAFTFVFDDPDWLRKVGIAALIMLIPVVGQLVVLGWSLRITRRVINDEAVPLPDVNFGEDIVLGLQAMVVALVYSLPILVLVLLVGLISQAMYMSGQEELGNTIAVVVVFCLGTFAFIYGLFMAFILPAAYANLVAKNSIAAGLRFNEVLALVRRNLGAYLVVLGGVIVAGFIAPLGFIACFVGVILTGVYAQAVMGHLYGQAYRETRAALPAA